MFWGLRFIDQGCSCFGVFVLLIRGVRGVRVLGSSFY